MRKLVFLQGLLVLTMISAPLSLFGQESGDCTVYHISWASPIQNPSDTTEHVQMQQGVASDHAGNGRVTGACVYSGANKSGACHVQCSASSYMTPSETGTLDESYLFHQVAVQAIPGGAGSNGGSATCGGQIAIVHWGNRL